mmetsp:Transcript_122366/g.261111  ORF Transcript_122366/g.261111 Transcript_122366/m.261111 type:complete len:103 (-) Transcript_122366:267-575(-)
MTRDTLELLAEERTGNQNSRIVAESITPPASASTNVICVDETWPPGKRKTINAPMVVDSPAIKDIATPTTPLVQMRSLAWGATLVSSFTVWAAMLLLRLVAA